ncbi:hypothetical protein [uncultured Lacinutrix sp.]|uniref:hypothetical protein n=1 Tax=uncultured Lacinutrix sp. TaxID=574032 RepID=UPI002637D808|nr:hypothetical protein [uncultured Lacinutrix sp.]
MNSRINNFFSKHYYEWSYIESFADSKLYKKFLNWISGEFDLFLQEEKNGLQIFFPNGFFYIKKQITSSKAITVEISIKSKSSTIGNNIFNQIISISNHLNEVY